MVEELRRHRTRLTWHWWLSIFAVGWPLSSWLMIGGFSDPALISNTTTTVVIAAGTYLVGVWRASRSKTKASKPIGKRKESQTMFIWLGMLFILCIALLTGVIGAMLFIGGMSDLLPHTPRRVQLWNLTGFAVATGPQMIVASTLILAKLIPLARREFRNTA